MTRKIAFTRTVLDRLTVPAGRDRIWVFDAHTPNLAYMKTAAGSTSYYRVYKQGKKPIRYLLGPGTMAPDAARDLCNKIAVAVANGVDVQQERRNIAKDATLGEIWNRYRDEHLKPNCRPSTITTDLSRFERLTVADAFTGYVGVDLLAIGEDAAAGGTDGRAHQCEAADEAGGGGAKSPLLHPDRNGGAENVHVVAVEGNTKQT